MTEDIKGHFIEEVALELRFEHKHVLGTQTQGS